MTSTGGPSPGSDLHIIEAAGKCRIVIRDGRVCEVGEPMISRCPLARRFTRPVDPITPDAVWENIQGRIDAFGMCKPDRKLSATGEYVGFGASEILSAAVRDGLLDAAIIACDGAGTVVLTDPALIQGIGGRMSGLVMTSPIPLVIARIKEAGGIVIDPSSATIDPVSGVIAARKAGLSAIGVTVVSAAGARAVRAAEPYALIIAVHTTGITRDEAMQLFATADIVTACASRAVRDVAAEYALLQAGISVPVFAATDAGKRLILQKVAQSRGPFLVRETPLPATGAGAGIPDPLV